MERVQLRGVAGSGADRALADQVQFLSQPLTKGHLMSTDDSKVNDVETTSATAFKAPEIQYPDGAVDISQLIGDMNLRLGEPETSSALYKGLRGIENGNPVVLFGSSLDYEALLTSAGKIGLDGRIGRWMFRGKPVALATLWERQPKLRAYLRSRTENFIARKEREYDLLEEIADSFGRRTIQALRSELDLLPPD